MKNIYSSYPLYNFIRHVNEFPGEKKVLDCGAGGFFPKLGLFAEEGYECYGIEIDEQRKESALGFAKKNDFKMDIICGDMKNLPYTDEYFDVVFSWNSIFHQSKKEVYQSIQECIRVLRSGGWLFINLLSVNDGFYGKGEKRGEGEYFSKEEEALHSFFTDEEADPHFAPLVLQQKTKRFEKYKLNGNYEKACYIDYIYRKK